MNKNQWMYIRGTAVLALRGFIQERFPSRYNEWLDSLSPESRKIHRNGIMACSNYLICHSVTEPTQKVCELFYNGNVRGAWEAGMFSAFYSLRSYYKIFVKYGSPQFIINKASYIFSSFYSDGELRVTENSDHRVVLQIEKFSEPYHVVEAGFGGWMEGALKLLGCENISVKITKSMTRGDAVTEFVASWA